MAGKIEWLVNISGVPRGQKMEEKGSVDVEKIEVFEEPIVVKAKEEAVKMTIQPSEFGEVLFLAIKAKPYGADLSYSIGEAQPDAGKRIKLDAFQMFIGQGALCLLGHAPQVLYFYNKMDKDTSIEVFGGRLVVPPSSTPTPPAPTPTPTPAPTPAPSPKQEAY